LDQIAHVGVSPSIYLKLISHVIIFEVSQSAWSQYLNVTDRRTVDYATTVSRTDDLLSHNRALLTSRGKNYSGMANEAWYMHGDRKTNCVRRGGQRSEVFSGVRWL